MTSYLQLLQQTIEQQKEMIAQQNVALVRQQEQTEKLQAMFTENMLQPMTQQAGEGNPEPKATEKETPTTQGRKAKEPDTFSSGPEKVDRFLSEFSTYMELTGFDKESQRRKLLRFKSYLRGPAHDWVKPFVDQTNEDFNEFEGLVAEFAK
ncbi:hypothetical protein V1519DRAFT_380780, partial [Lipomyces tetrasporus]